MEERASAGTTASTPNTGIVFAALIASWGWLMWVAHYYWGSESYYDFCWFVPFLAGLLVYRKTRDARFAAQADASPLRRRAFYAILPVFVGLVLLSRLLGEANFGLRLPLYTHGAALLGLSWIAVGLFTGWRGLAWFAFPLFFFLMALPWPVRFETQVIQSLTGIVTNLTVAVINLIGYPAVAIGNTIRVADVQVGVDEACSGIRSLQALIMIALFFGEFFRFGIGRRLVLLLSAVAVSMSFNGTRAVILTLVTVNGTEERFQFWHDFLGTFNAVICGLILYGITALLDGIVDQPKRPAPSLSWFLPQRRQALAAFAALAGGFLLSEAVVQGYFTWRGKDATELPPLTIQWPEGDELWHEVAAYPEHAAEDLNFDYGEQVTLTWSSGLEGTAIYYGYDGSDRYASIYGYFHKPTTCLPGSGAVLNTEKPPLEVSIYGYPWRMNHYEFIYGEPPATGPKIQVFWLIWENKRLGTAGDALDLGSFRTRLQMVRDGRRDFNRQVMLIYFIGEDERGQIRQKVSDLIDRIVITPP